MDALPQWPEGTVAVLATRDVHQIPVSLVLRAGDHTVVVGLAPSRESLENLRENPDCAVTIVAPGLAFTAYGRARIEDAEPVVVAHIEVLHIVDHDQPTFEITSAVTFRWTDEEAERRDADAREALRRLSE